MGPETRSWKAVVEVSIAWMFEGEAEFFCVFFGVAGPGKVHGVPCVVFGWCGFGGWVPLLM